MDDAQTLVEHPRVPVAGLGFHLGGVCRRPLAGFGLRKRGLVADWSVRRVWNPADWAPLARPMAGNWQNIWPRWMRVG